MTKSGAPIYFMKFLFYSIIQCSILRSFCEKLTPTLTSVLPSAMYGIRYPFSLIRSFFNGVYHSFFKHLVWFTKIDKFPLIQQGVTHKCFFHADQEEILVMPRIGKEFETCDMWERYRYSTGLYGYSCENMNPLSRFFVDGKRGDYK